MGFEKIVRRGVELGAAGAILFVLGDLATHFGKIGSMWSVNAIFGQDGIFGPDGIGYRPDPNLLQIAGDTYAGLDPITDNDNPMFLQLQRDIETLKDPSGLTDDQLRAISHRVHVAQHLLEHAKPGHVLLRNFAGGYQWISLDNPLFVHLKHDVSLGSLSPPASYELYRFYEHARGHIPDLRVTEGSNLSISHKSHLVRGTDVVRAIDLGFVDPKNYTPTNVAKVLYEAQTMTPQADVYYEVPKDTTSDDELKVIRDRIVAQLEGRGMSHAEAHEYVYGNGSPESGHVRRVDATGNHFHQNLLDSNGNPLPNR